MNLSNLSFQGGSEQQINIIVQVHQMAIAMAQKAQKSAMQGGDEFTQMFGTSYTSDVSNKYFSIEQILSTNLFLYNMDNMISYQIEKDLIYCLSDSANNLRTIIPWKGLFLQEKIEQVKIPAALSLIFIAAGGDDTLELSYVNDKDSSVFLAKYNPQLAIKSPRNYMYFASYNAVRDVA